VWTADVRPEARGHVPGVPVVPITPHRIGESIQRRRCALGTWPDLRPNGARTRHIGTRADVVVLDLALPDTDGWEIARRLKGSPTTAAVPIIALTGATLPHERASAMRAAVTSISPSHVYPPTC